MAALIPDEYGADAPAVAEDSKAAKRGRGRPAGSGSQRETTQQLAGTLMMAVGFLSLALLTVLCWPDRETAEAAALTPEEAEGIAAPLSRLMWRYVPARRYLKAAAGAEDWLLLGSALWEYGWRVAPIVSASRRRHHPTPAPQASRRATPAARPIPPAAPAAPDQQNGQASPDDIAAIFAPLGPDGAGWLGHYAAD